MTTITIKNGSLKKTNFSNSKDLFLYLKQELNPLKIYLVDEESISETSLQKIRF